MSHTIDEPILRENTEKYTMFPLTYPDIFEMYKKQVDSFWRTEEIDLSRDLVDWAKLKIFRNLLYPIFRKANVSHHR